MKKNNSAFNRIFMVLVFLFLYAPILLLIVFSFNKGNSNVVWSGFSLHWYKELFQNRIIMRSVYTTLMVSLLAMLCAVSMAVGSRAPQWPARLLVHCHPHGLNCFAVGSCPLRSS